MQRTCFVTWWIILGLARLAYGSQESEEAALKELAARSAVCLPLIAEGTVTQVVWNADGESVTFCRPGHGWFRCRFADGRIDPADGVPPAAADPVLPPPFVWPQWQETLRSPDGRWLARYKDFNIALEPQGSNTGERVAVTTDGEPKRRYGITSWVYQEDQAQFAGMWWSGDSTRLAFVRFDERGVPDDCLATGLTEPHVSVRVDAYPLPGDKLPVLSLHVFHLSERRVVDVDCGVNTNQYIYNIHFAPDGKSLLFNRLDRPQKHVEVLVADIETGKSRVIAESSRLHSWELNHPLMVFLKDGRRFIWGSYPGRCDWPSLEICDLDGKQIRKLTDGNVPVGGPVRIDEDAGWYYYTEYSPVEQPLNMQLWRMRLDSGKCEQITPARWNHSEFHVAPDGNHVIARAETLTEPPRTILYDREGKTLAVLAQPNPALLSSLGRPLPELFTFPASEGGVALYGIVHKPVGFDPSRKYPLLLTVYNGTGSKAVHNVFAPFSEVAARGYLAVEIDGRGTAGRGYRFMEAVYARVGDLDLQDQADGVRVLCRRPYVDAARVGVTGGSHGGFMSALAILKHPDVFAVSVAGYGPTDWRYYSAIYPERFLGLPSEHPEAYEHASCMHYAAQLKGKLLLFYGLVDYNVRPAHAWRLIDELDRLNKPYEIRVFPRQGHGLCPKAKEYRWEFFSRHLRPNE